LPIERSILEADGILKNQEARWGEGALPFHFARQYRKEANRKKAFVLADQLVEHGRIEASDFLSMMNGTGLSRRLHHGNSNDWS